MNTVWSTLLALITPFDELQGIIQAQARQKSVLRSSGYPIMKEGKPRATMCDRDGSPIRVK
jgi:hypothetical protein